MKPSRTLAARPLSALTRCAWLSLAALALCAAGIGEGRAQRAATPGTSTSALPAATTQWLAMPVAASEVALTPAGDVLALDAGGALWRLSAAALAQGATNGWTMQPGRFARLRALLDGSLWALDPGDVLYRLQGSVWRPVADGVRDVTATPDGMAWWLLADGRVLDPASGQMLALPSGVVGAGGSPGAGGTVGAGGLQRLLSDEHGLPWLLATDGRAWRQAGSEWREEAAATLGLRDLAIAGDGTVLGVTASGAVLQRHARTGAWQAYATPAALNGQVARVALGATGLPWLVTRSGGLVAERPLDSRVAVASRAPALFTRLLSWRPVGGQSVGVALGPDGTAFSLAHDGSVWQWQGDNKWASVGGRFRAIAAGPRGAAWAMAVGSDGRAAVQAFEGGLWRPLPGSVKRIAAGPGNTVWAVAGDDTLQRWNSLQRQWERVAQAPADVAALAIGPGGAAWIVRGDGAVQTLPAGTAAPAGSAPISPTSSTWQAVPGISAGSLAVGPEDTVYATALPDGQLMWLDRREMQWKPASGNAIAVAVGPEGAPWIVTPGNVLLASGRFLRDDASRAEAVRAAAAAPARPVLTITPAVTPSTQKPLSFEPVFSADLGFVDIAIGSNGAVFAIGSEGGLFCFSNNSRRFLLASAGQARRVAVSADGQPLLLNRSGVISRFAKGAWAPLPDFLAQDVAVGPDGQTWAVDRDGDVHRLVGGSAGERFERVARLSADAPFKGLRVAGANAGVQWLVTEDKRLLRCEKGNCATRLSGVQDVAVAPDNTVFIVDLMGKLRRANALGTAFDIPAGVSANTSSVALAVGPQGLPWLLSADGKVSSAGLFNTGGRSTNTDSCVLPFAQSPAPVEPPPLALRLSDVVQSLPPGASLDLLTRGALNGRALQLDEVSVSLNDAGPLLSLRDGSLQLAAAAAAGSTATGSYTVCPKRAGSVCATARLALTAVVVPEAPRGLVVSPGNGQASVSFSPPTSTGGGAIIGYTVTASPGGLSAQGAASPIVVSGLSNGTAYTFTVSARNASGLGPASVPSAAAVPSTVPGAPQAVVATAGNVQASVAFAAPASNGGRAITGYTVTASPGGATEAGTASPIIVSGLSNGTAYTFTVSAGNANGSGPASTPSAPITPRNVAGAPTAVVANAGNGSASIAFVAPANTGGSPITGYAVVASPGGLTVSGAASPVLVNGLANGTAYSFTVAAINSAGTGVPSLASAPVTPSTVPGAPTAVSAVAGNAQASVSFAAPADTGGSAITGYTVTANPGGATATGAASPIVVNGLTNGTAYTFTVSARNANGSGAASQPATAATPLAVPGAPTGVVATRGNAQASVSFAAPLNNGGSVITDYTVTASPGGATASGTASPIVVTGLANGTAYMFTVRANNVAGSGASSTASAPVTPATVPSAPTGIVEELQTTSEVRISFSPSVSNGGSAITGYRVVSNPPDPALVIFPADPTTFRVQGLTFTTAYTFTVVATNAVGDSAPSAASRVVNPSTRPLFPGAISGVPGNGLITVNLATPASDGGSAITSYTVVVFPVVPNGEPQRVVSGPTNAVLVTGLTNGVAYCYLGWASNANGRGATSPACPAGGTTPRL